MGQSTSRFHMLDDREEQEPSIRELKQAIDKCQSKNRKAKLPLETINKIRDLFNKSDALRNPPETSKQAGKSAQYKHELIDIISRTCRPHGANVFSLKTYRDIDQIARSLEATSKQIDDSTRTINAFKKGSVTEAAPEKQTHVHRNIPENSRRVPLQKLIAIDVPSDQTAAQQEIMKNLKHLKDLRYIQFSSDQWGVVTGSHRVRVIILVNKVMEEVDLRYLNCASLHFNAQEQNELQQLAQILLTAKLNGQQRTEGGYCEGEYTLQKMNITRPADLLQHSPLPLSSKR